MAAHPKQVVRDVRETDAKHAQYKRTGPSWASRPLVMTLAAAFICGCGPSVPIRSNQTQKAEPTAELVRLADGLQQYIQTRGSPPASKEDFHAFCSSSGLPCCTLDWSILSWEWVDNRRLVVTYKSETYSLPITMEKHSGLLGDADAMRHKLRQQPSDPTR